MVLNATQLVGVLAFACAAAACAWAGLRRGKGAWWVLAAVSAAFAVEVLVGLRHRWHDAVDALLMAQGWYEMRAPVQVGLSVLALLVAVGMGVWLARAWRADRLARVAGVALLLVLMLFFIETVSLHGVDAVLYAFVGPVRVVGWVWAAAAGVVCWAGGRGEV